MANSFVYRARPALVVAALAACTAVVPTVALASPSPRQQPSIDDVQKKLGRLSLQNSQLVEQFDHARVMVGKRDAAAATATRQAQQAQSRYRTASVEFAQNAQAAYQAGSLGSAGALLDSDSGPNYLDRLDTLGMISSYDADVVSRLETARAAAQSKSAESKALLAAAKRERDGISKKKDAVKKQISKYTTLLGTLNSAQRRAYAKSSNPSVDAGKLDELKGGLGSASADAKKAVNFAINQVGKPYVFGAEGPGSYDCSGLTKAAWSAGGVGLPHSAADQYNYGHHVSLDKLTPGDLIFMYHPIGHVTIYIGDGKMVSAPTEGQDVTVIPVSHSANDIVGATHIG